MPTSFLRTGHRCRALYTAGAAILFIPLSPTQAEDGAPPTELDRIKAKTELATAKAELATAEAKRIEALGLPSFEGKTTMQNNAGALEVNLLSATAIGGAAGKVANAVTMSIDLKMALADQFDSVSDFSSAVDSYFETYYTKEEQAAARTAQFASVFDSLGLAMPGTLAAFRQLVDAQDLTTAAGQATYATRCSWHRPSPTCNRPSMVRRAPPTSCRSVRIWKSSCWSFRATPPQSAKWSWPISTKATARCSSRSGRCRMRRRPPTLRRS